MNCSGIKIGFRIRVDIAYTHMVQLVLINNIILHVK